MDSYHEEYNDGCVAPARPKLEEVRGEPAYLMLALQTWAHACNLRYRHVDPPGPLPEDQAAWLKRRLEESGG